MRRSAIPIAAALLASASLGAATPEPLFVLLYRAGPAWRAEQPMARQPGMAAHGAYMRTLFEADRTIAAGPTTDAPGGVVLARARDLAEARAMMAADPAISSGLFVGEVRPWQPVFRSDKPLP